MIIRGDASARATAEVRRVHLDINGAANCGRNILPVVCSSAQFDQRPPVTPRWFPDCREGVSHTTSDHSDRATDGGRNRVKDTVEENRKKIRCVRDSRMKGQRVLRSDMKMDMLVSSNRCKPQRIYGNGAGNAVNFNLKKKKWMHSL